MYKHRRTVVHMNRVTETNMTHPCNSDVPGNVVEATRIHTRPPKTNSSIMRKSGKVVKVLSPDGSGEVSPYTGGALVDAIVESLKTIRLCNTGEEDRKSVV